MKKLLTSFGVIIALIFSSKTSQAQETSIGPMVGLNGSTIVDMPLNTYKPGVNIGLFLNHSNKEHFGLKAEAMYSQMGTLFDGFGQRVDLLYIHVPLYGVLYLNDRGNDFRPKLMVGPYAGFLLSGTGSNTTDNQFVTDNFNRLDFGAKGAVGFNWKFSPRVWLNSEFYVGGSFANIYKTDIINVKNRNFGLNAGLSFPLQ